jgi:7,8-dihydropterin-6-yl-methyl-4-(beta-D-ribofuranosyl)aminobenzene 5'-phosphate synthase
MKITITYDNEAYVRGLVSDWGFSCLVELEGHPKVLFDTGTIGRILLRNMEKLSINPGDIAEVFISHGHHDHVGGLSDFLGVNSDVEVYVPASVRVPASARRAVSIQDPIQIHEDVFSTGKLKEIEQSMAVRIEEGLVVIVGCSHPGVETILEAAGRFGEPYALIGGLHGFSDFDLLQDLEWVCPTHCTRYKSEIESHCPEKYIQGGVGKVIEF